MHKLSPQRYNRGHFFRAKEEHPKAVGLSRSCKKKKAITRSANHHHRNILKNKDLISQPDLERSHHARIFCLCRSVEDIDQTAAANHNAAAYVLTETRKVDYITPILRLLHCLTVCQRVSLKILLLVYKAPNGSRLKRISYLLVHYKPLRSSGTGLLSVTKDRKENTEWQLSGFMLHKS